MNAPVVGAIGLASTLFGGMKQAQGAAQMGAAQQGMYEYQAGLADINAKIALQNADYARDLGEAQAAKYGMAASQRAGQIVATQASSGLNVNSGSNAQVQAGNRLVTGIDLNTIRANAAKTAYDYDVSATAQQDQAQLYHMAGANAKAAASINVESSILGTAGSVSSKWLQGQQLGLFGGSGQSLGGSGSPTVLGYSGNVP